jgi:hypothetical protein
MASGKWCPFVGKKCVEHKCVFYKNIIGTDPQTGVEMNQWDCAIAMMPTLAIEVAHKANQTAAAVDTLRTELDKHHKENQLVKYYERNKIIESEVKIDDRNILP